MLDQLNTMIHYILDGASPWRSSNGVEITPNILIVMLSLLLCMFMFRKPWKKPALPPGPRGLPIIGYVPFLGTNLPYQFRELARQYGPIYKVQLGSKLCVVVSSPSVAKEVTRDQDIIFANHDPTVALDLVSRGGLDITFAPYGSYWRNMRKIFVQEMLRKSNLDAGYDLRKVEVRKAIKLLSSKVGTPVDIGQLIFTTTMDVFMSMVWGRTVEADEQSKVGAEFRAVFQKFMDLMMRPNFSDILPVLAKFDIQGVARDTKAVLRSIDEIFDRIIEKSGKRFSDKEADQENESKEGNTKRDFIQFLLELGEQEETGLRISMEQIKSILLGFVIGGPDTTATTAKSAMIEILHNREVMQKVQKELEDVVGVNNIVQEFHLPKLQYLGAVVKETLRLHPTLPVLIQRRSSQSCTLAGYTIPKGTKLYMNVWAIQRDPELWVYPSDFKPERFLNEPGKWDFWGNNFQYLPFGSGRRVCPGIPLAERMMMYTLASLFHSFDWQTIETKDVDLSRMENTKSLLAVPTMRLSNSDLYT